VCEREKVVDTGCEDERVLDECDGMVSILLVFKTSRGVVTPAENAPEMDPHRAAS
jgi:hypothetical protein